MFDLRLHTRLTGPCMRCLGFAEVEVDATAREFYDPSAPPADVLRSDYVVEDRLEVGAWARDAIGLALPEQILCRPDCAGLCPVCGKDLNVEPHEHIERDVDPRWVAARGAERPAVRAVPADPAVGREPARASAARRDAVRTWTRR